jgi:hypothetical protein
MSKLVAMPSKALIDEYGELDRQANAFKPVAARLKVVKDEIASCYADSPGEAHEAEGKLYLVQVSPRATERKFIQDANWKQSGMYRLQRLLGIERFLTWCTFPLASVDRLTSDTSTFLEETQTGTRTVKAVLKEAARRAA